ncbi:pilin [Acinetobacter johnsonii]|uniref:pilin n=1 Tax=Acinetobacter johnsonii TaxID=40214 RepID=UPI00294B6BC8|nr:pilin [Acinetobacter johnsonii]
MNAQKGFTLIELMIVVAIIGILAAIAIPQYQNYIAKSQVSRVMSETGSMKTVVEDCVLNGKTAAGACDLGWTNSNLLGAATGNAQTTGQTGLAVGISNDGAAEVEATFGGSAAATLKTKTLKWARTNAGVWTCTTNVDTKYQPAGCGTATPSSPATPSTPAP